MWFNPLTGEYEFTPEPAWSNTYVEKARAEEEQKKRDREIERAKQEEIDRRRQEQLAAGRLPGDLANTEITPWEAAHEKFVDDTFLGDAGRFVGRLGQAGYRASEQAGPGVMNQLGGIASIPRTLMDIEAETPATEKGIVGRGVDAAATALGGDGTFSENYNAIRAKKREEELNRARQMELAGTGKGTGLAEFGAQMVGDLPVYAAIPEVGAEALATRFGGSRLAHLGAETVMNLPTDVGSGYAAEKLRGREDSLGQEIGGAVVGRGVLGGLGKFGSKLGEELELQRLAPQLDNAGRSEFKTGMDRVKREFGQAGIDTGKIGYFTGNEAAKQADASARIAKIAALTGSDPLDVAKNLKVKGFIDENTMLAAVEELAKANPGTARKKLGANTTPQGVTVGSEIFLGPDSNFSTNVHELMHALQSNLNPEDKLRLEKWAGVKDGEWTDQQMEKVAQGFERFIAEGKLPGEKPKSKLGEIFQQASEWMRKDYQGKPDLPSDIGGARPVFEGMVGAEARPSIPFDLGGAAARAAQPEGALFQSKQKPLKGQEARDVIVASAGFFENATPEQHNASIDRNPAGATLSRLEDDLTPEQLERVARFKMPGYETYFTVRPVDAVDEAGKPLFTKSGKPMFSAIDIGGVTSEPTTGKQSRGLAIPWAMMSGIEQAAKMRGGKKIPITLDAYDIGGFLPDAYRRFGFEVIPDGRYQFDPKYLINSKGVDTTAKKINAMRAVNWAKEYPNLTGEFVQDGIASGNLKWGSEVSPDGISRVVIQSADGKTISPALPDVVYMRLNDGVQPAAVRRNYLLKGSVHEGTTPSDARVRSAKLSVSGGEPVQQGAAGVREPGADEPAQGLLPEHAVGRPPDPDVAAPPKNEKGYARFDEMRNRLMETSPSQLKKSGVSPELQLADPALRERMLQKEGKSLYDEGDFPKPFHQMSKEEIQQFAKERGITDITKESPPKTYPVNLRDGTKTKINIPGGLEGRFTYKDLFKISESGHNPDDWPDALRIAFYQKLARSQSPVEPNPLDNFNRLLFASLSPNTPLFSNLFQHARLRAPSEDSVAKLAALTNLEQYGDPASVSRVIRDIYGLGPREGGGIGASSTIDMTSITGLAKMYMKKPEFFMKTDAESWYDYAERLASQIKGQGPKVSGFTGLTSNPEKSGVSAIDLHMARAFEKQSLADKDFSAAVLAAWNANNPKDQLKRASSLIADPGSDRSEFFHDYQLSKLGGKPIKFRDTKGRIRKEVPEHLRNADWIEEPEYVTVMPPMYRRMLEANQKLTPDDMSLAAAQWMLWDGIRKRVEPHYGLSSEAGQYPKMDRESLIKSMDALTEQGYRGKGEVRPVEEGGELPMYFQGTPKAELETKGQSRLFEGEPKPVKEKKTKAVAAAPTVELPKEERIAKLEEELKTLKGTPAAPTKPEPKEKWIADTDPGYSKAVEKIYKATLAREGDGKHGFTSVSLAKEPLGVGAQTARKTLQKMEQHGLLESVEGKGYKLTKTADEVIGAKSSHEKAVKEFESGLRKGDREARLATETEWMKESIDGAPPQKPPKDGGEAGAPPPEDDRVVTPSEALETGLAEVEKATPKKRWAISEKLSGTPLSWLKSQIAPIRHRLAGGYLGKEGQRWNVMEETTNEAQDRLLQAAAVPLRELNAHLTKWKKGEVGKGIGASAKEAIGGGYSKEGKAFLNEIRDYMIAKTLKDDVSKYSKDAVNFGEKLLTVSNDFGRRMEALQIGVHTADGNVRPFQMREDWAIPLLFPKDMDKGYNIADSGRAGAYSGSVYRERDTDIKKIWAAYKAKGIDESQALPDGDEFYTRMREYFEKSSRVSAEAENFGHARKKGNLWMEDSLDKMMKVLLDSQTDDKKKRYVDEVMARAYGKRTYNTLDQYASMAGGAEATLKLFPLSALPQFVQGAHIMAKTGFSRPLFEGAMSVTDPAVRALIEKSGGVTDSIMQGLPKSFRDSPHAAKVIGEISRKIGMLPNRTTDEMVRFIAGATGKKYAEKLAADVMTKGPKMRVAEIELKRLGINPSKVRDAGGILNSDQVEQAVTRFIRRTQTTGGPLEQVGGLAGSPKKQLLFQFMGFMLKNAYLISDEVVKGAQRTWQAGDHAGAINKLAAYGVGSLALGAGSVGIRDLLTSKKYKEGEGPLSKENVARYASQAVAMDVFLRMMESYDREDKIGMLPLGPATRDALNLTESMFDMGWIAKRGLTGEEWLAAEDTRPIRERAMSLIDAEREAGRSMSMSKAIAEIRKNDEQIDLERRFKVQSFKDKAISSVPVLRAGTQGFSKITGRDYRADRVRRVKLLAKPKSETEAWKKEQERLGRT